MTADVSKTGTDVPTIVNWDIKYSTGINLIDAQHQQLIILTNQLYAACFAKEDELEIAFKAAMKRMVEYVRFHLSAEVKFLEGVKYPDSRNHKKMHDTLIQNILDTVKSHDEGKKFVPNNFVRTLVDWIFGHIAFYDKAYSVYIMEQLKSGALTHAKLKEIETAALG